MEPVAYIHPITFRISAHNAYHHRFDVEIAIPHSTTDITRARLMLDNPYKG